MKNLKSLGFRKNWIYEVIVSTASGKTPDAAPMGVSTKDFSRIEVSIYKSSQTCGNILSSGCFVVNFSTEPMLFYQSLYEKEKLVFRRIKGFNAPVLRKTDAFLLCKVKNKKDFGDKVLFKAEIVHSSIKKKPVLINRAESLALEALIKSSRIPHLSPREKKILSEELRRIARAAGKVAPRSSAALVSSRVSSLFR